MHPGDPSLMTHPLKTSNPTKLWQKKNTEITGQNYLNPPQKIETYVALNRDYTVAAYMTSVSVPKLRKTLTKYRQSKHNLAVNVGWHRQTWLPREERLCAHWDQGTVETELHFLNHCKSYETSRNEYFTKITHIVPDFPLLNNSEILPVILVEKKDCGRLAAKYLAACHELGDSRSPLSHELQFFFAKIISCNFGQYVYMFC